jgi:hypothetical protein
MDFLFRFHCGGLLIRRGCGRFIALVMLDELRIHILISDTFIETSP